MAILRKETCILWVFATLCLYLDVICYLYQDAIAPLIFHHDTSILPPCIMMIGCYLPLPSPNSLFFAPLIFLRNPEKNEQEPFLHCASHQRHVAVCRSTVLSDCYRVTESTGGRHNLGASPLPPSPRCLRGDGERRGRQLCWHVPVLHVPGPDPYLTSKRLHLSFPPRYTIHQPPP